VKRFGDLAGELYCVRQRELLFAIESRAQ
jgi:hypothetical protein